MACSERMSIHTFMAPAENRLCMTGLPSLPVVPFRTMIRDKKAVLELSKTNFSSFSLTSLVYLVSAIAALVVVLWFLQ